jgi:hypothetical protein
MRRLLLMIVAAAACGGSPKPTQLAPLPDDPKPASSTPGEVKPATPDPVAVKPEPPAVKPPPGPPAPIEIRISPPPTTIKVVSGGKGKKELVRYTAKPGGKQAIEFAMDFTGKQDTNEQVIPTIVLTGEAETTAVDKDGTAAYRVTITGMDARAVTGSNVPVDKFKDVLSALAGLTIDGKLGKSGAAGDVTLRIEKPREHAAETLELIRTTLPALPMLPSEAVGVGAKWQATTTAKLAERLDIAQVTDYELIAHKGTTWTIKGTTKVTGKDQEIESSKVSSITGSGEIELTITDGALYPSFKSSLETQFTASVQDKSLQFLLKVGGSVTPKAP